MTFKAPFITYERVGYYAEEMLKKYHPSCKVPIPVEGIIEFDFSINIVPFPNLYRYFGQSGFLSFDKASIFIDEYQYDNFVEKYRFTLAHELGHVVMHKPLYEGPPFNSMQEYIEFLENMPQNEIYWYETQGDWFAGQLLVPTKQLEHSCVELLEANRDQFSVYNELPFDFWSYASNELANIYKVNPAVIEIRITKLSFADKFRNYFKGN